MPRAGPDHPEALGGGGKELEEPGELEECVIEISALSLEVSVGGDRRTGATIKFNILYLRDGIASIHR